MSAFERFGLYAARIGDNVLEQLDSVRLMPNNRKTEITPGGLLTRKAIVNAVTDPEIRTRTRDLVGLFTGSYAFGISTGYAATTEGSANAASIFQGQRRLEGGTYEGTGQSKHFVATVNKSFSFIEELRAEQDSITGAVAEVITYPLSTDGQTAPLTYTAIGTLSLTPDYNSVFYLGPVWIDVGGTEVLIAGAQSVTLRPGMRVVCKRADGDAYPQKCAIYEQQPELRISTVDLATIYTHMSAGFHGRAFAVGITAYLQKGQHGGVRVAKATEEHIRLDLATSVMDLESIGFEGQEDGSGELVIRGLSAMSLTPDVAIYAE